MSHIVPFHLRDLHRASKAEVSSLARSHLYPKKARSPDEEPKIPDPKLFASLPFPWDAALDDRDLPTVGECAVHLELLETFHKLRLDIINSQDLDSTFGVTPEKKTVYRKTYEYAKRRYVRKAVQLRDTTWPTRRRQKWSYFLDIAVGRFKAWMRKMNEHLKARNETDGRITSGMGTARARLPFLPPLDILVVWHAFLLNPHSYDRARRRQDLAYISALIFPWEDIHAAINSSDWTYTLPKSSALWAKTNANVEPDLFGYLCQAGKASNSVSTTLARNGQRNAQFLSHGEVLDVQGLTSRDSAFLAMLQQTVADKEADKPLVKNVHRQASFVDKMHAQLWIRSPAVEGTLRRAADRYEKFLRLFQLYPGKMLVPTLDVDLAWHTHLCSAGAYAASVKRRTGVFINHDDKLGRPALDGGMEETKKLFFMRFGEEYERCLCWDCEATASVIEEADEHAGSGQENTSKSTSSLVERVRKTVEYYRLVEISRRAGNALPIWTP